MMTASTMPNSWRISSRAFAAAALALLFISVIISPAAAHPYPKDELHNAGYGYLIERECAAYCGVDGQYCCKAGQQCFTSNGIAGCTNLPGNGAGGVGWFTTTWTETETFTSTISTYWPAATATNSPDCIPNTDKGQTACGSICCADWQFCAKENQCAARDGFAGGGGGGGGKTTITESGKVYTTQYSAPYRVTSGTATATATRTGAFTGTAESAAATGGAAGADSDDDDGLSGGAIAGIVIGSIAGVGLLILLCFCCIVRGLWGAIAGLFGRKRRDHDHDRETIIEEEVYHRRGGSRHGRKTQHGGWFGAGGGRPSAVSDSRREKRHEEGGHNKMLGLGALGTLMLLLGLKRDHNKPKPSRRPPPSRRPRSRSDISSAYYSEYTSTDPSSVSSSDRPTRATRHSRPSDTTRYSRSSRR